MKKLIYAIIIIGLYLAVLTGCTDKSNKSNQRQLPETSVLTEFEAKKQRGEITDQFTTSCSECHKDGAPATLKHTEKMENPHMDPNQKAEAETKQQETETQQTETL